MEKQKFWSNRKDCGNISDDGEQIIYNFIKIVNQEHKIDFVYEVYQFACKDFISGWNNLHLHASDFLFQKISSQKEMKQCMKNIFETYFDKNNVFEPYPITHTLCGDELKKLLFQEISRGNWYGEYTRIYDNAPRFGIYPSKECRDVHNEDTSADYMYRKRSWPLL